MWTSLSSHDSKFSEIFFLLISLTNRFRSEMLFSLHFFIGSTNGLRKRTELIILLTSFQSSLDVKKECAEAGDEKDELALHHDCSVSVVFCTNNEGGTTYSVIITERSRHTSLVTIFSVPIAALVKVTRF